MNSTKNKTTNTSKISIVLLSSITIVLIGTVVMLILQARKNFSNNQADIVQENKAIQPESTSVKAKKIEKKIAESTPVSDNEIPKEVAPEAGKYAPDNHIVYDKTNNRTWHIAPDKTYNFYEAQTYADDFAAEQHDAWRLPTFSEIKQLYNEKLQAGIGYQMDGKYYPAKIDPIFNAVGTGAWFWVSDRPSDAEKAMAINLHLGIPVEFNKLKPSYPAHIILIKN